MVAAAPAATAAVARWERVVGMARNTEALGGYYVMEQNAATRKETSCQDTTHMSMSIISCAKAFASNLVASSRLYDKKSHKSQISINRPSCTCTQKRHDA